jgi:hypothetical protein
MARKPYANAHKCGLYQLLRAFPKAKTKVFFVPGANEMHMPNRRTYACAYRRKKIGTQCSHEPYGALDLLRKPKSRGNDELRGHTSPSMFGGHGLPEVQSHTWLCLVDHDLVDS